jgi:RNA-directed DNA polymerase
LSPYNDFSRKKSLSYKHNAYCFLSIENDAELCRMLQCSFSELAEAVNNPVYHTFEIPKKKGGKRIIDAPDSMLKEIQSRLNYFLNAYYLLIKPKVAFGFVIQPRSSGKICSIAENAKPHVGKKQVLNIDIKDFFPSIKAKQVRALFQSDLFDFDEHTATVLALLSTYKGVLPIGAPTSPAIANFICYQLDNELQQFCIANDIAYTRYADDLTFSSTDKIDSDIILDIISIINKQLFSINEKKFRIQSPNSKQTVTGLVVNQKVNVDRKLIRKIRAILHDSRMNGVEKAAMHHFNLKAIPDEATLSYFIRRLEGLINFIGQVRGKQDFIYCRFKEAFNELFNAPVQK